MKLFKTLFLFCLLTQIISAKDIYPTFILTTKGHVLDFVYHGTKLYVANDVGSIEIFDLQKQQRVKEITLPKEVTLQGELYTPKIISIDYHKEKLLLVSTSIKAYRNLWLYDFKELKQLISTKKKMSIKTAKFMDEERFILGTLGHEVSLYNQKDNYKTYTQHIENSTFTDMILSEDKKFMLTSSESGRVSLSQTIDGKLLQTYETLNVDNINKIDYANETIITAGQDRRVGVYGKDQKPYYIQNDFIVYAAAINPSATTGVYSSSEKNELQLFKIHNGEKTDRLIGHYAIPTKIKFINDKELFSAGYENNLFYWNLNLSQ